MSFSHGSKATIISNGVDLSPFMRSAQLARVVDVPETSHFRSTAKTYIASPLKDATMSLEGMFDGTEDAIDQILAAALGAVDDYCVALYRPVTEALGSVAYGMAADESSYDIETATDDVATIAAELQSSTQGERCLTHKVTGAVTAAGNGTAIDNAAASSFGGYGYLEVSDITAAETLTVILQHSADNSVWVDLIEFAAVTAVGAERVALDPDVTVNRYTRDNHDITGGSATYSMAFGRRTY